MKFTLSWLKDHLDTTATVDAVAPTLNKIGLEVEGIDDPAIKLNGFVVAEVISAEQHPDADRLKVCKVNNGREILNIVCGAPNCRTGLKTVLAPVGAVIPKTSEPLKKGKIRGAESNGMLCSYPELQIDGEDAGIIELPADALVGSPATTALGATDAVIEIGLTPNRGDCAGVRGIARDLAAAGLGTLKPLPNITIKSSAQSPILIARAVDEKLCLLFMGRMITGVKNGPSPAWLQNRLKAIGLRPISILVDITNYFTYDRARPLHVFDANKIAGGLTVRLAHAGEELAALNDKTYVLQNSMVVIADTSGVQSLAGIIGGASTGCTDDTVNVFLEAALWDPINIAQTGRALQIHSDARYRFERGVDPLTVASGLDAATQMILDLCGGTASDLVVEGVMPTVTRNYVLRANRVASLGGIDLPQAQQQKILEDLGFVVEPQGPDLKATPPSWRSDIMGEADLVEEILRIVGFDTITAVSLPPVNHKIIMHDSQRRSITARHLLAARGLLEAVTWSFISDAQAQAFGGGGAALQLANAIAPEMAVMRPNILPGLLAAAQHNRAHGLEGANLFEIGPIFHGIEAADEETVATILRTKTAPRDWQHDNVPDVFAVKADALATLAALDINTDNLAVTRNAPAWYHPGRSGTLSQGRTVVGYFGELHPKITQLLDIKDTIYAAEVFLSRLPAVKQRGSAKPLLRLPSLQPVRRDFAFIMADNAEVAPLVKAITTADKQITAARVFDIYTGKGVEPGTKSVALTVTLQPGEKAFTDAEIEVISAQMTDAATKAGGKIR